MDISIYSLAFKKKEMKEEEEVEGKRLVEKRNEKNIKYMQQTLNVLPSIVVSLDSSK